MSELDDLLKELESGVPSKVDDLDDLISEFEVGKAEAPHTKNTSTSTKDDADLDRLLQDLGEPSTLTTKLGTRSPKPMSRVGSQSTIPQNSSKTENNLDSLLEELSVSPTPKPTNIQPKAPVNQTDDLDSLLNSLTDSPSPKSVSQPISQNSRSDVTPKVNPTESNIQPNNSGYDDIDSLIESLNTPSKPKTTQPGIPPSPSQSRISPSPSQSRIPPSPSQTEIPQTTSQQRLPSKNDDELDSLISSLGSPQTKSKVQRNTVKDPLDSLLTELDDPRKQTSIPKSNKGDDLDSLMAELSVPKGNRQPQPQFQPQHNVNPIQSNNQNYNHTHSHNHSQNQNFSHDHSHTQTHNRNSGSEFNDFLSDVNTSVTSLNPTNSSSRGKCWHCHGEIHGDVMRALGRVYHPEHFNCASCHNTIGTRNFYDVKGYPHCEQCYQKQFCPICSHCGKPIADKCVTAMNKRWHLSCFVCTQCLQPFSGNYYEKDQRPYCEKCYNQVFSSRCRACHQPIYGDCINALGSQWHPEHFNCQFCHEAFTGMFYELDGLPYCSTHYYQQMGETCAGCDQPIAGTSVEAMGKKWHPEHFVCAFCMNTLSGTSYTEKNSKPYCKGCHSKLFA